MKILRPLKLCQLYAFSHLQAWTLTFVIHHFLYSFDRPYWAVYVETQGNKVKQNDETVGYVHRHNEESPFLLYHEYHKLADGNDDNDQANDFCDQCHHPIVQRYTGRVQLCPHWCGKMHPQKVGTQMTKSVNCNGSKIVSWWDQLVT